MLAAFLAAVAIWFGVHWAFVAVMHAKAAKERGVLSRYWRVILLPLAVIGLVLDAVFNLTFGTLMYRELPRELLFTSRCKRHKRGDGWRKNLAEWFCRNLNVFDPGHC
jgi:hypothetical protein